MKASSGYVQDQILVEFGGRNATEPSEVHVIRSDLAELVTALEFPTARVSVFSPKRSFWEMATLIHVECNDKREMDRSRKSRHWYDLVMLYRNVIGQEAMADRALLKDVVDHKKVFFHSGHANYDECLSGGLRLVPDETLLADLAQDFKEMENSGMFDQLPPAFSEIVEVLKDVEAKINNQ